MGQTRAIDRIVVIADNCTDATEHIAKRYGAEVYKTEGNTAKKAGALNQALHLAKGYDFILDTDADSIVDRHFVERSLALMEANSTVGAVSAREGMRPLQPKHLGQRLVYAVVRYQRYLWDSMRMEHPQDTTVVVGPAALLRTKALLEIGGWDNDSLTEDLALSLDLRQAGWRTVLGTRCYVWSDSPLDIRGLFSQRVRWSRGYEDTGKRPWSYATASAKMEIFMQRVLLLWLLLWVFGMATGIARGVPLNPVWLLPMGIVMADRLSRLRFFPKVHASDVLLTLPPLELAVFACWQLTVVSAHIQGYLKMERNW
jgi:cellulose synthase/poly-beta-1,6-N-acetylglucosamine synthase-like glycosyltransferase